MSKSSENNKRIAKNTLFLYVRMLFLMVVTLFTSRVLLDKLGIEDFGIYNVVGGLALMFIFFRSSLSNATQRFLNVALGRGDAGGAARVFAQHFTLYLVVAAAVVVVGETVGLWFVYNKLVIPADRLSAAVLVYQFTLVSLCSTLVGVVYDSTIIAHEDMNVYSYVGIFEGLAKLGIAYAISMSPFDRLVVYGLLLMLLALSVQCFYAVYCSRRYAECRIKLLWDRRLLKETSAIVGWNTVGTAVYAVNDSGVNILLNLFFGPAVNAARAVSFQVSNAVNGFASNFFVSVRPQIVKSYAAGDDEYLMKLFYSSSKFSFFLLWIFCLPLCFTIDPVLHLWLTQVPEYTGVFTIWILAYSLVNVLNNPVWAIALAVGRLKRYISVGSGVFLMVFPLAYAALKAGASPVAVFAIMFFVRLCYLVVVLHIIKAYVGLSFRRYFADVVKPIALVVAASLAAACALRAVLPASLPATFAFIAVTVVLAGLCIGFIGLRATERAYLLNIIKKKFK